jgi:hypothetical protein
MVVYTGNKELSHLVLAVLYDVTKLKSQELLVAIDSIREKRSR